MLPFCAKAIDTLESKTSDQAMREETDFECLDDMTAGRRGEEKRALRRKGLRGRNCYTTVLNAHNPTEAMPRAEQKFSG